MNLRSFSIAFLISALPLMAAAQTHSTITLDKGDFVAAERVSPSGETEIKVKLSKSGKAKFKKLNAGSVDKNVHADIGGIVTDFKLKEPIRGDSLEMGPYSADTAQKVIAEINGQ